MLVLSILFSMMAHIPTIHAQPPSSAISPKVFIISMVCHGQSSSSFVKFKSYSPIQFFATLISSAILLVFLFSLTKRLSLLV